MKSLNQRLDGALGGRGRQLVHILFAAALSLVVAALVARGLPPIIDGAKKWLIVALAAGVNFGLSLMVLGSSGAEAPLDANDELEDEGVMDDNPPAVIRGAAFSDPAAVVLTGAVIALAGVALAIPLGVIGGARFVLGAGLFMLPGYLLSVLLMPKSLGLVGRILLSAVLSAAVVPTVAQVLYWMGFLFTTWIALIATLGVSMLLLVIFRLAQKRSSQAGAPSPK